MTNRTARRLVFTILAALLLLGTIPAFSQSGKSSRALRVTPVVKVVRQVAPSVVYISCEHRVNNPFAGSIWDFFGNDFGFNNRSTVENSLGSGFIVDKRGYILTNEHVILNGSNIRVTLNNGKEYPATVVGTASDMDLALLKIKGQGNFPTASLGRSDDLMIGEKVIAVGNPFGLSNTVTVGVLSATGRTVHSEKKEYSDFLQTDAPINPGNSGGPLLNILGQVVGINTAIIRRAQGIGFAIPIDRAKLVMNQLMTYGKVKPVWVGFLPIDPTENYRRRQDKKHGFFVLKTFPYAYPQDLLEEGDWITSVNGKAVHGAGDFNAILAVTPPGKKISLKGTRGNQKIAAYMEVKPLPERLTAPMAWELLGLRVVDGNNAVVVKDVRRGSAAEMAGLREGDVVLAVGETRIQSSSDFLAASRQGLKATSLLLSVARGRWNYYVTLNLVR